MLVNYKMQFKKTQTIFRNNNYRYVVRKQLKKKPTQAVQQKPSVQPLAVGCRCERCCFARGTWTQRPRAPRTPAGVAKKSSALCL